MTFFPIIERELRVAARRAGSYRHRCLVPVMLLLVVLLARIFLPFTVSPGSWGRAVYRILTYLALLACLLDGVRQTADCISQEKREGTLGLLFLTDLDGLDVVLGKLAAAFLASIHGLLSTMPVFFVALLLGGVTEWEIIRISIALGCVLLFSLSAGLWVSSRSISASHAMGGTAFVLFVFMVAPWLLPIAKYIYWLPGGAFFVASNPEYTVHTMAYWASLILTQGAVALLLWFAGVNTNQFREGDIPTEKTVKAVTFRATKDGWTRRAAVLDANPVSWLAGWKAGPGFVGWGLVALAVAGAGCYLGLRRIHTQQAGRVDAIFLVIGLTVLIHVMLKIFLAARASRCLAEARQNSTLELLLCAPLSVEDILRGQIKAMARLYLKPFLVLFVLEALITYWLASMSLRTMGNHPEPSAFGAVVGLEAGYAVFFFVDLQTVVWTGIWFGLCSKNESIAAFKTAVYIIILPMLFLPLGCIGLVLFLVWPVMAYYWARLQLQEHFRFLAGLRFVSRGNLTEWLPFHIPSLPAEEN